MDDDFLVWSYSEDSCRHAILADDGLTGILYLHGPSDNPQKTGPVEATCFAYNRIDPIEPEAVQSYRPKPPPIAKGYASKDAVCSQPTSHTWDLLFSSEGTAVLLMRDGEPWAIAALGARRGISKAIQSSGPWGNPWSAEFYEATDWVSC
jgi:hypothetical protein